MTITTDDEAILRDVLDEWQRAVGSHNPQRVAAAFTDDAIFQGLHPYSVGPRGVAEYYAAQPVGMTAAYRVLETRRPAADLVLGYVSVDFSFIDRPTLTIYLSVLIQHDADSAKIIHYQVSRLE